MQKSRRRIAFRLRFWVLCALLLVGAFIPIYKSQDRVTLERQQELAVLQQENNEAEMREQKLRRELDRAGTEAYRIQEMRRRYGYGPEDTVRFVPEDGTGPAMVVAAVQQEAPVEWLLIQQTGGAEQAGGDQAQEAPVQAAPIQENTENALGGTTQEKDWGAFQ